ncbi:MAG: hypothetical protein ACK55Z_30435 [bacterium]|jgi:hypothetical protein
MPTITTHKSDADWVCACGNTPDTDGFFSCDSDGNEMEPTLESDWDGLFVCASCGELHAFEEAK